MTRFEKLTMIAIAFHRLTLLAVGLHVYKAVSRKVVQKDVKVHATIPKGVVNKFMLMNHFREYCLHLCSFDFRVQNLPSLLNLIHLNDDSVVSNHGSM